jgi:hypothetical protein
MLETVLKRFEEPDEVRTFEKGKFELVHIGGMTIGRATYEPGWKWSVHVGPSVGASRCNVEHVGLVISGCATAAMEDGTVHELAPGCFFTFHPDLPVMIVGWSGMCLTSRSIFSGLSSTQTSSLEN